MILRLRQNLELYENIFVELKLDLEYLCPRRREEELDLESFCPKSKREKGVGLEIICPSKKGEGE